MKKTIYISISAIAAILIIIYFVFIRSGGQTYSFRFEEISQGDITVFVTATGTINAVTTVEVGTQVSGIVARLYADFNSIVKKGQLIAQIDSTFLIQSVKDAEANLERARAQYTDSRRNLDRVKILLERGLESQLNYDASLTTYESNEASLKSAQAALDRAKINLAYAYIHAPIDGVVINRAVNIGQTVAASFSSPTLFTIANDLKKMQVETTVDETDIGKVSTGQKATFTVDAYPEENFTGTVSQIRLAPQSVQNVVNYIVIVDVNNDKLKLMPGMTANVKILIANASNVMRISNLALRFQPPGDLIDTTGSVQIRKDSSSGRSFRNMGDFSESSRARFKALGDSIQAAHGKKLTPEQLLKELQKVGGVRPDWSRPNEDGNKTKPAAQKKSYSYGITSNFPEYQKNAYEPSHQSGRGRLWILKSNGKLESISVRTRLNDGRYTQIISEKLKSGDKVVLGATINNNSETGQVASPLSGSSQQRRGGGFR
ncbi:MAG: efflux RND transporter periplasmic adaptor subunit [Bacteroidetes bacterium]|nr:efflux RND transporter periplasmic adaptor subunit [Bacteroidota bacterium]